MSKYETYSITTLLGTVGDMETERWTDKDWDTHREYIKKLKASGEYLKPHIITIHIAPSPLFDNSNELKLPIASTGIVFLDLMNKK